MRKRLQAAVVPAVVVAAIAGAAGYRAQDSGSGRRLDELHKERPAAATHFPVEGALVAASRAADVQHFMEAVQAQQLDAFYQGLAAQAEQAAAAANARKAKSAAPTGRGGSGGGCSPDSIVQRESKGDPNAVNTSSGAGGKYQFLPSTWSGYGGYARAQDAPESVQDERFNEVWAGGSGSSHWGC
jgi:Transglycosylase-like domain